MSLKRRPEIAMLSAATVASVIVAILAVVAPLRVAVTAGVLFILVGVLALYELLADTRRQLDRQADEDD